MKLKRILKHLITGHVAVRRAFPPRALQAIEQAIRDCETAHRGQIRFAVESALNIAALWRGVSAKARAIEVFSRLRVWDTEHNNGVLIYLLLADHDVEIVADRGVHAKLGNSVWEEICRTMERAFRERRFEEGVIAGIRAVGGHLQRHYPSQPLPPNELPDKPFVF
ncbi:MAG: TPM domain-containing protein [Burkholderiales bacterium]